MKFRVIKFFPKDASIRGHRAKRSPQIFLPPVQIQNDKESNNHPFDLEFAEIPDRRIKKGGAGNQSTGENWNIPSLVGRNENCRDDFQGKPRKRGRN